MSLCHARRSDFRHVSAVPPRWSGNETYGHVNNVVCYGQFDTAVTWFPIENGALDIDADPVVGYVVESGCSCFQPMSFPDLLHVAMRVSRIGGSSVRYEVALFRNAEESPAAAGHVVHVYVDRRTGRPGSIPEATRRVLATIADARTTPVADDG